MIPKIPLVKINTGTYTTAIRLKKKQKRRILLAVAVGVILGGIIMYNYTVEQIRIKGGIFGDAITSIQDDLVMLQTEYSVNTGMLQDGEIRLGEFQEAAELHFAEMERLIQRYEELDPPEPFRSSVEFFKLSSIAQLERDRQIALWLETGDESYNIRADRLHQESFAYELAALSDFKAAQSSGSP